MADSLGPMKDWQGGDEIAATDLQAFADRLRGFPITFTGRVYVSRDSVGGMHVHVFDTPPVTPGMPTLHITSAATGGGQYICREVEPSSTAWNSATDLPAGMLGTDGDTDVL